MNVLHQFTLLPFASFGNFNIFIFYIILYIYIYGIYLGDGTVQVPGSFQRS